MTCHQIEDHLHAPLMGKGAKLPIILVGAVPGGGNLVEVGHIIAGIKESAFVNGIEPNHIKTAVVNIIQLFDDAPQIADSVAVGIVK